MVALSASVPPARSRDAFSNDVQHYGEIADSPVWPVGVVTVGLLAG
jgi:hypothetical protein